VHYRRILKKDEEKVNKKSNNINRNAIAEALKSMLIFFLAMIQYNIFRIIMVALREKDDENEVSRAIFTFIYNISEIIMLIFLSYQLQKLLVRIELEERNKAAHNNATIE
jgi:prolipoprotein diacylglyceryltransferase